MSQPPLMESAGIGSQRITKKHPQNVATRPFRNASAPTNAAVQEIVESQRQSAVLRTMFIPFYAVGHGSETTVYMVLKILDPLPVTITAISSGEQIVLEDQVVQPSRGLSFNLRQALGAEAETHDTGILRLDYVGNPGTLQAWGVIRTGEQIFEIPFVTAEKLVALERLSFWNAAMAGNQQGTTEYTLTNTTAAPVGATLTMHRAKVRHVESFLLPAFGSRSVLVADGPTRRVGWLSVTTDTSGVVVAGIYRSAAVPVAYAPLVARADAAPGPEFELIRLPVDRNGRASAAHVTLFNTSTAAQTVTIDVLESHSGRLIGTRSVQLEAEEVLGVDLLPLANGRLREGLRARVTGEVATLLVDGASATRSGAVMDISAHATRSAHHTGTYPIPPLQHHDVRTTIINLDDEPAEIAAQYFWDGGTFAVPIFTVPANGGFDLDPKTFAASGVRDLAGRVLDANGRNLALKWMVWKGSKQLIGRTETRPVSVTDGFGFNCGGCCWQIPEVAIVPDEVELGIGDAPLFQAVMYEHTCTGTLGPWASSVTASSAPSPFIWDYVNITTSGGAEAWISFDTVAEQYDQQCLFSKVDLAAFGRAKACDKVYNPKGYNATQTCAAQTATCTECLSCCTAIYQAKICKGSNQQIALSEKSACEGHCTTDRC